MKIKLALIGTLVLVAAASQASDLAPDLVPTDSSQKKFVKVEVSEGIVRFQDCAGRREETCSCEPLGNPNGYDQEQLIALAKMEQEKTITHLENVTWRDYLSVTGGGALAGACMGSGFGPIGAGIGAAIGGLLSGMITYSDRGDIEDAAQRRVEQMTRIFFDNEVSVKNYDLARNELIELLSKY